LHVGLDHPAAIVSTRKETAIVAKPIGGNKDYQKHAERAFPVLVRYALAGKPTTYGQLAEELGIPNPRNLNYVLGCVGQTLIDLAKLWEEGPIPPLQCLVLNKSTGLPGEGIGWFISESKEEFSKLPKNLKKVRVYGALSQIYGYRLWSRVLDKLNLAQPTLACPDDGPKNFGRGGESYEHLAFKEFVSQNPQSIHLLADAKLEAVEFELWSGDAVDAMFRQGDRWIAVEVKSRISNTDDIKRGLFQCVKYEAVLKAMLSLQGLPQDVSVKLALESDFPASLNQWKNTLSVSVIEQVRNI
jgi:hypothetical protein